MVLHQPQLFFQPTVCLGSMLGSWLVVIVELAPAEFCKGARCGLFLLAAKIGKRVAEVLGKVEPRATLGDQQRVGYGVGTVAEDDFNLVRRAEVEFGVGLPHRM